MGLKPAHASTLARKLPELFVGSGVGFVGQLGDPDWAECVCIHPPRPIGMTTYSSISARYSPSNGSEGASSV